jgi:hypothetical protein
MLVVEKCYLRNSSVVMCRTPCRRYVGTENKCRGQQGGFIAGDRINCNLLQLLQDQQAAAQISAANP